MPELGKYVFTEKQVLSFQYVKRNADFHISKQKNVACLDADLVEFPLTIRYVENGDRFVPFGMKGSKLVSDFLTNCKVSLYDKRQQLVVTDAHQNIIWLVNHRPRYRDEAFVQKRCRFESCRSSSSLHSSNMFPLSSQQDRDASICHSFLGR